MTVDLACLVVHALWGLVLVTVEILGKTRAAGRRWNLGNRDAAPTFPAWVERAGRALANHKENFPLFATAVIVVHLTGSADTLSAAASVIYVAARAVHGLVYVAGITGVRSAAYVVGVASALAIYASLVV